MRGTNGRRRGCMWWVVVLLVVFWRVVARATPSVGEACEESEDNARTNEGLSKSVIAAEIRRRTKRQFHVRSWRSCGENKYVSQDNPNLLCSFLFVSLRSCPVLSVGSQGSHRRVKLDFGDPRHCLQNLRADRNCRNCVSTYLCSQAV